MRCDPDRQEVTLAHRSTGDEPAQATLAIQTETVMQPLAARRAEEDGASRLTATLAASDPLLDAMAITKGRFAVALLDTHTDGGEAGGGAMLYLPAWVEVSRVIEDCR